MTAFSKLFQSGMTFKPLMESHGEALLMSYLAAFHAKTSQQLGGGGITGAKSSMWKHMARIIREVGPRFVFVENSPMLASRGLSVVLGDLAQMGFDARWCVLGAKPFGAKHKRDRMWIMGNTNSQPRFQASQTISPKRGKWDTWNDIGWKYWERTPAPDWSVSEAVSDRVPNGMAYRLDRFKAIGNGQSPVVAATAWRILNDR
jgi:DNA (cytosine-5)-methyltransferase 1